MAGNDPKAPTRRELAQWFKDPRSLRAFEELFKLIPLDLNTLEAAIEAAAIEAGNASASATSAHSLINVLESLVKYLALVPAQQHNNSLSTDYIDLPLNGPHEQRERRIQWNNDDGTMDVGLYGGSVLQVGQETMFYAKNTDGSNLANGTPVMFNGTVGASGKLTFEKAVADGSVPAEYMMGVCTQDIDNNAFGYVTSFGLVRGFRTDGNPYGEVWNDGDLLYFDPATPGTWTNVQPSAPNIKEPVAVVIYATSGNSGSIFVRMGHAHPLNGLQDVDAGSPTNHDLLEWNSTNSRYQLISVPYVNGVVMDKTAGVGIKIDKTTPDYGWEDMLGEITARGVGATNPTWSNYRNGIYQYLFSVNDEVWTNFHILHDYAPGTDLFIHAHWSHNSAAVTTGAVTWDFEITYAKGHDQAAFPATVTRSVTQNASTTQYQHMIAETQMSVSGGSATQIDTDDIEVDGLILVRATLAANTMDGGALPFLHMIDIHYQSTGITTKNKAPNFYS